MVRLGTTTDATSTPDRFVRVEKAGEGIAKLFMGSTNEFSPYDPSDDYGTDKPGRPLRASAHQLDRHRKPPREGDPSSPRLGRPRSSYLLVGDDQPGRKSPRDGCWCAVVRRSLLVRDRRADVEGQEPGPRPALHAGPCDP